MPKKVTKRFQAGECHNPINILKNRVRTVRTMDWARETVEAGEVVMSSSQEIRQEIS